jgi:Tfp pilus assembly protein PilE
MKYLSRKLQAKVSAFTLAEMMVVLLIVSVVLACLAPAMTTKIKADQNNVQTSPWKWVATGSNGYPNDAYFGQGNAQIAHIGQIERADSDNAKFVINNTSFDDAILFKNGANALGRIRFQNDGLLFGSSANTLGQGSVSVGRGITSTSNSVVVGNNSTGGNNGAVLGNNSTTNENAIVVGNDSTASPSAIIIGNSAHAFDSSIVIGNNINNVNENSISIGNGSSVNDVGGIAIGEDSIAENLSVAIGSGAEAQDSDAVAIGSVAKANSSNGIAIGNGARSLGDDNIAIGASAIASADSAIGAGNIAIGSGAMRFLLGSATTGNVAVGYNALRGPSLATVYGNSAIGYEALARNSSSNNTAVGYRAMYGNLGGTALAQDNTAVGVNALLRNQYGSYNTAIGENACRYVKGSRKICIGMNSGPTEEQSWSYATDTVERIFIGSKSNFNGGPAVLEVHNDPSYIKYNSDFSPRATAVVINGHLIVKGNIITSAAYAKSETYAGEENGNRITTIAADGSSDLKKGNVDVSSEYIKYYNKYGKFLAEDPATLSGAGKSSDRRLKYVGNENNDGLAKLRQIKVFNYTFKKDPKKIPHVGVMAQDLQKIFPHAVKKGADGFLVIRMEDMFYAVINAIKELDTRVSKLEKENQELKARLEKLEAKVK